MSAILVGLAMRTLHGCCHNAGDSVAWEAYRNIRLLNRHLQQCMVLNPGLSAGLTVYSGIMFGRLRLAVPDAVLFGDIGHAAFGRVVSSLLYVAMAPHSIELPDMLIAIYSV
jgi:hypothetical protein